MRYTPAPMSRLVVAVLLFSACPQSPPPPVPSKPDAEFLDTLERERLNVLADTCFRDSQDTTGCAWTEHAYAPDELPKLEGSSDETVLMVDTLPRLTTAMFRYRARIRGYYRPRADGSLGPAEFTWRLPTKLHDALEALRRPYPVPAEWLTPLSAPLYEAYGDVVASEVTHGAFVFTVLAEPSPRHTLILVDSLDFRTFAADHFCDPADDGSVERAMRTNTERLAGELRALMTRMNVRYVNYSAGWSLPVMRETWQSVCGAPLPGDDVLRRRLATFEPIAKVLFASEGVVTAHAADDSAAPLDFPYDQRSDAFPNRARVGVFQALDSGLAETGGVEGADAWPGAASADVWLNSGVLRARPFPYNATPMLSIDAFGTSVAPLTSTKTSWLTPLALARFIHLREAVFSSAPFDDALVKKLLDGLTPASCPTAVDQRCRFQDPLRHGQTDAMRIGLRSVEYSEQP